MKTNYTIPPFHIKVNHCSRSSSSPVMLTSCASVFKYIIHFCKDKHSLLSVCGHKIFLCFIQECFHQHVYWFSLTGMSVCGLVYVSDGALAVGGGVWVQRSPLDVRSLWPLSRPCWHNTHNLTAMCSVFHWAPTALLATSLGFVGVKNCECLCYIWFNLFMLHSKVG